jgi:hypothetical protein
VVPRARTWVRPRILLRALLLSSYAGSGPNYMSLGLRIMSTCTSYVPGSVYVIILIYSAGQPECPTDVYLSTNFDQHNLRPQFTIDPPECPTDVYLSTNFLDQHNLRRRFTIDLSEGFLRGGSLQDKFLTYYLLAQPGNARATKQGGRPQGKILSRWEFSVLLHVS